MRELEPVKNRVVDFYRKEKRKQARLEKAFTDTPGIEAQLAMVEQQAYAKALRKIIDYFEEHMGDHDFPEIP